MTFIRIPDVFGPVITLVIGFIVVALFFGVIGQPCPICGQGHLQVQKLNEQIRDLRFSMESHSLTSDQAKKQHKSELKAEKAEQKKAAKRHAKQHKQDDPLKRSSSPTRMRRLRPLTLAMRPCRVPMATSRAPSSFTLMAT